MSPRWNRFERLYIRLFGQVDLPTRMRARLITNAISGIPWKTMLDFGSGTGAYSFYFSREPEVRVWGMDIDKSRISDCNAINRVLGRKSLDFICGASIFAGKRFQPGSMDVVLAVEVLPYLPDIQAAFQEIQQVLKTGGYFICHFPVLGYQRKYETTLLDPEKVEHFIEEAGLESVSITRLFGRTADLMSWIFSCCGWSRFLTALTFPLLLLASLPCGGRSPRGSYCMVVARKK